MCFRNLGLNTIARYRRQRTDPITDFDELPVLMDLRPISNLNPESEALVDEQLRFAGEAVEQLTPRVREVFILRKVYGLTHKEIAARLGITVSTPAHWMRQISSIPPQSASSARYGFRRSCILQ